MSSSPVAAASSVDSPLPHAKEAKGKKAIVVGSGFGGLAAAVRLLAQGFDVEVFEALDQPGGRARVFRHKDARGSYVFDAGPTVITAPFMFEELWQALGERMQDHIDLRPVTPFYRIRFSDGVWFDYTGDAEAMAEQMARLSPGDEKGYRAFLKLSEKIFAVGFEKLAHRPFGKLSDMLRIVPAMMRLKSYRTVYGLAKTFVRDERLRQVLSFHPLLVGGNPFDTTSIYTLILHLERKWGVHFPMGGTGELVHGLMALIERHGGRVHLSKPVERIEVDKRRAKGVLTEDGVFHQADVVVSNADAATTYQKLIRPEHRRHWTDKRLEKQKYSMGLFVWYFGTQRTYPDVAHHSILLGPRYKALLADIFNNHHLAPDFSLYLHRPTATDPSLAPQGCDSFYVLSPVPHLDAGIDWSERAASYQQSIMKALEDDGVLPDLQKNLTVSQIMTPQHFLDELKSYKGAAFSLAPVLQQSAYFRPHNQSEDVDNLYLVGAGTHPGAGVPGVLSSAKVLDTVVAMPKAAERP